MITRKSVISALFVLVLIVAVDGVQAAGDPARGSELHDECIDCHGEDGLGDEEFPRLAGLDDNYLLEQMMLIKKGEHSDEAEMMLWIFEDLEGQDLADLAAYYASLDGG